MKNDLQPDLARRRFFMQSLAGASLLLLAPGMLRPAEARELFHAPDRTLALTNLHTGERCAVTYWESGNYVTESLTAIRRIMRDHRNDEEHPIDEALLDLLYVLRGKLGSSADFEVVSGYRSPASNAALHARSGGVASKSLHMQGKAIDIRVPGRALDKIHTTALAMGMGGVGYYPSSNFVHVDTGRVRQWGGA